MDLNLVGTIDAHIDWAAAWLDAAGVEHGLRNLPVAAAWGDMDEALAALEATTPAVNAAERNLRQHAEDTLPTPGAWFELSSPVLLAASNARATCGEYDLYVPLHGRWDEVPAALELTDRTGYLARFASWAIVWQVLPALPAVLRDLPVGVPQTLTLDALEAVAVAAYRAAHNAEQVRREVALVDA